VAFTTDVERWTASGDWLRELGEVVLTFTEVTGLGALVERRVMFADGTDVDLVPVPIARIDEVISADGALPVLARGYRLLVDKDDRFADLPAKVAQADPMATHSAAPWPADASDVANEIQNYLYHVTWTAKKLRRGELAVAVRCQNRFQGSIFLRFVEWQAKARSDGSTNTYYEGRFLERWAAPDALDALAVTQTRYDVADCARSIAESLDAFGPIAREVAEAVGVTYPDDAHAWTRTQLGRLLPG